MSPFSRMFRTLLKRSGMSQREFARRVKADPATINQAANGKHTPRWEKGPAWADALGLDGDKKRDFIEELALAQSPPPVRELVKRLRHSSE